MASASARASAAVRGLGKGEGSSVTKGGGGQVGSCCCAARNSAARLRSWGVRPDNLAALAAPRLTRAGKQGGAGEGGAGLTNA